MKFTKIPETAFQEIQLNAGVLLKSFDPEASTASDIFAATSGGINFKATPSYSDYGEDIDNCPKNTKELKELDAWDIGLSGTAVTVNADNVKTLIGAADIDAENPARIVPRNDLSDDDFEDLWWVGDYSDKNGEKNGGFMAIHMMNTLSTGGFQIQTTDRKKGQFAFNFTAHYSIAEQDKVPFEVYVQAGTAEQEG